MRHYHVLVEFLKPAGHARAFARLSESQVKRHFIFPWTKGDAPIGPDHDVMANQVSRLRVFRAAGPEALTPASGNMATGAGEDVTDLFLSDASVHVKSLTARRPLLFAMVAAAITAILAMLRSRKSAAAGVTPSDASGQPSPPRVSHV